MLLLCQGSTTNGTRITGRDGTGPRVECAPARGRVVGAGSGRGERRRRRPAGRTSSSHHRRLGGARAGNYWAIECGRTRVESAQRTSFRPFSMPGPRLIEDVSWPSTTPILVCAYVVRTVCVPSRGRSGMEPYTPRSCYSIMAQSFLTYTQASLRWYVTHCTA